MSDNNQPENKLAGWAATAAFAIALACFLFGIAAGYVTRGALSRTAAAHSNNILPPSAMVGQRPSPTNSGPSPNQIMSQNLQAALSQQLPPLLERLKSDPQNAKLLADIGNMYFDARQYRDAATYYDRSLKIEPNNISVRTDLGNSYWYSGNADQAIAEFRIGLKTEPHNATVLFNLGMAEWMGKTDANAALATWQKLLDTNPHFAGKSMVVRLIAQAKQRKSVQSPPKNDKAPM